MEISLQQAIEIHAKSMRDRFGAERGTQRALQQAMRCRAKGDNEGFLVWIQVRNAIHEVASSAPTRSLH